MKIYLDNAATTPLSTEVFQAMQPYFFESFGNPSSAHAYGKEAKTAVEESRRTIADLLNADPSQIIFTSGGTEADNTAILSTVRTHQVKVAITTAFEHHAVLNTLKALEQKGEIQVLYVKHDEKGNLSLEHLAQLLAVHSNALVSIMHGNNEIGNLNPIAEIAEVCCRYGAIFHSDTVQTMGQYAYDTQQLQADFLVGSAHKFHGPKGIGFLYKRSSAPVNPLINGGSQESSQRSGTENVTGIVGLAKALELAYSNRETYQQYIGNLKERMIQRLVSAIPGISFNGHSADRSMSLATVLSVSLPDTTLVNPLTYLDQNYICASGGSACSSRSGGSHVLNALGNNFGRNAIRFSFSRYNTSEEVDHAAETLANLFVKAPLGQQTAFAGKNLSFYAAQ